MHMFMVLFYTYMLINNVICNGIKYVSKTKWCEINCEK